MRSRRVEARAADILALWEARGHRAGSASPGSDRHGAGLRMTGMGAPMALESPINGDWFEAYVAQALVPTLRPGDIVTMDDLSSHKLPPVWDRIERQAPRRVSSRPTAPTSTRSKRPSHISRLCCERLASTPSSACGTASARSSTSSSRSNASATSVLRIRSRLIEKRSKRPPAPHAGTAGHARRARTYPRYRSCR